MQTNRSVGALLRQWRLHRRLSQLDVACEADVSTRHLSFVETGRSLPSREMVMRLAERLQVPLRERNALLVAAGYAPLFAERPLHDPALAAARQAVDLVLSGHEPYPALAIDRHWTLVAANGAVARLLGGVDPALLAPPVNVLRLSLHPAGLAPRIVNFAQWRAHLLARLHGQIEATADPVLGALMHELCGYPVPQADASVEQAAQAAVVVPLRLSTAHGTLELISTTTVFGTPVEVTLSELALESFYPASPLTAQALRQLAEPGGQAPSGPAPRAASVRPARKPPVGARHRARDAG